MKKKVMVNNSKKNNVHMGIHSRSWCGTGTKMWRG